MQNKKLVILIILAVAVVVIWMPKGKRARQSPREPARISSRKATPAIQPAQRERTKFADWGRNPFVWARLSSGTISDFTLSGIIWDEQASYAIIDGMIVHPGDEIAGRIVKRIEPSKVILTDGVQDYILELE